MSDDTQTINETLKVLTKEELLSKTDQVRDLLRNGKQKQKHSPKAKIAKRKPNKIKDTDPTDCPQEILNRSRSRDPASDIRADGRKKHQPVMEGLRTAIARYIDQNPLEGYHHVASKFGVGDGTVLDVLVSAPSLSARTQQKLAFATLASMHGMVHQIVAQINQGLADGSLKITDKYVRDFAVSMGIAVDKLQLLTGQPTERKEYLSGGSSLDERRKAMVDVLNRAEAAMGLKALPGGRGKKRQAS